MRSEFEKLLKQHRDALTDELVKLGKYREVQLVEWDIERNETDYAFYFEGAWNAQQSKIDDLQKRVDLLEKAEFKLAQVRAILQNNPKLLESILVKKIEQALKGENK